MRKGSKIAFAVVVLLTIGASSGIAEDVWTSSQTGSITVLGTTYYPWDDWSYPVWNWQSQSITGTWEPGNGFDGFYVGTKDASYSGPGTRYTGTWTAESSGSGGGIIVLCGTFEVIATWTAYSPTHYEQEWDGSWITSGILPSAEGTLTGLWVDDGQEPWPDAPPID